MRRKPLPPQPPVVWGVSSLVLGVTETCVSDGREDGGLVNWSTIKCHIALH